jgi:hypothetical protein
LVEFVFELQNSAVCAWTGFIQVFLPPENGANTPEAGLAHLAHFSGEAGSGGARDIVDRLGAWAKAWRPVEERGGGEVAPLELVKHAVGMLGDFVNAFGLRNVMPLLTAHAQNFMWLLKHCHEREKGEEGTAARETTANIANLSLGSPPLQ